MSNYVDKMKTAATTFAAITGLILLLGFIIIYLAWPVLISWAAVKWIFS
jgi:hypothetical protein